MSCTESIIKKELSICTKNILFFTDAISQDIILYNDCHKHTIQTNNYGIGNLKVVSIKELQGKFRAKALNTNASVCFLVESKKKCEVFFLETYCNKTNINEVIVGSSPIIYNNQKTIQRASVHTKTIKRLFFSTQKTFPPLYNQSMLLAIQISNDGGITKKEVVLRTPIEVSDVTEMQTFLNSIAPTGTIITYSFINNESTFSTNGRGLLWVKTTATNNDFIKIEQ